MSGIQNHHHNVPMNPHTLATIDGAELLSKPPSEEFLNTEGRELMQRIERHNGGAVPSTPDNPPCHGCKAPYAGTMQCGRCEATYYCSRECQVSHWSSQHKGECAKIKKSNEGKADLLIENFTARALWRMVDVSAVYKAAVQRGLHGKIIEVLESDRDTLLERYRVGESLLCYTHWVTLVMFRGNRAEGTNHTYTSVMDGQRIKGFVKSSPDAFFVWMQASIELVKAYVHPEVVRNAEAYTTVKKVANEVWEAWDDVFTNPVAAKAILLAPTTPLAEGADGTAVAAAVARRRRDNVAHATKIVVMLREALKLTPWTRRREENELSTRVRLVAARIHVCLMRYQVPVDAEHMFRFVGEERGLFRNILIPMSKATIAKGKHLSDTEMVAVAERITQAFPRQGDAPR